MIIILRGHIRQSFQDELLYDFIKHICLHYANVEIYIHTWNIVQSEISWREIETIHSGVNEQTINMYFKDMSIFIKKILIEDDTNIKLNGNVKELIPGTKAPIIGWKNYWYGKYQIMKYIKENVKINVKINDTIENKETRIVLNMRFDLFSNSHAFSSDKLFHFMNTYKKEEISENKFLKHELRGFELQLVYLDQLLPLYLAK